MTKQLIGKMNQSDKAYKQLHKLIVDGKIKKGYPIYEKDLAAQFNMSRTPVREAINRLLAEDMIEVTPRRGIFIKTLNSSEINSVYEMAEGLEGMVSYLVAQKRTAKDIEKMNNIIDNMDKYCKNNEVDLWAEADENLHKIIHHICDNKLINDALSKIYNKIHQTRFLITRILLNKEQSNIDHRKIIEAIEEGDAYLARRYTFDHWYRIRMEIIKILQINASNILS